MAMMKVILMVVESAIVIALEKVAVIQMMMLNTIAMVVLMLMAMGKGNCVGFGCGHGDTCGFTMNECFRHDDIYLIPTIAMRDVFDADDESFMFFCHLDADDCFDAYASIPVCLHR